MYREKNMNIKNIFHTTSILMIIAMFSVSSLTSGCGKQEEPVISDSVETVDEQESKSEQTEEPKEEAKESQEETEQPEELPSSEDDSNNEPETTEEEPATEESEPTGIEIVEELDQIMYVQTSANARSGDSTDYDVVTTFGTNTELHVTGRTSNDWYRVEQSNGEVYISGKLLGMEKVVVQQKPASNSGQTETPPASNSEPSGGVDVGFDNLEDSAFSDIPEIGSGGLQDWGGSWNLE